MTMKLAPALAALTLTVGPGADGAAQTGARLADPVENTQPLLAQAASVDTLRYVFYREGVRHGEAWRVWQEAPDTWRYEGRGVRSDRSSSRLVLGEDGLPVELEITGELFGAPFRERFERRGDTVTWSVVPEPGGRLPILDEGVATVSGPVYYPAIFRTHDLGVLVRVLLRRPGGSVPLLPEGEARLESLGQRVVEVDGRRRTIRLFAVHGLDLEPEYVWLDEDGTAFAEYRFVGGGSIRAGWEAVMGELLAATGQTVADEMRSRAAELRPPRLERPLALRNARLFDPVSGSVREGLTIVIDGARISAVGPDGSVAEPAGAEVIDAGGRMVLPGLWDTHSHLTLPLWGPLNLAAGVTSVRDMSAHPAGTLPIIRMVETDEAVGPRVFPAGPVEGVASAEEARAAVDRYAELGYGQIKLFEMAPELVPVIAERARHHGMRTSGHFPQRMSTPDAVQWFDELVHLFSVDTAVVFRRDTVPEHATVAAGTQAWDETVALLLARGVTVEATFARNEPGFLRAAAAHYPTQAARRLQLWLALLDTAPAEWFARSRDKIRALYDAGVPLLLGSDGNPVGWLLHHELEVHVQAGIPEVDVLRIATLGAARVVGVDDDLGSIEPGKLADLIVVDGDPTTNISDIRRVVTVVKDGRVYDPAAIYRSLGMQPWNMVQGGEPSGST
jgi:hypothetical protein